VLKQFIPIFGCLVVAACNQAPEGSADVADLILIGDNIITMDDSEIGAVAVVGDRIAATGTAEAMLEMKGVDTRVVELGKNALLPGFIDAHGHFAMFARLIDYVNLSSPPVGPVEDIDDIVRLIRQRIDEQEIADGEWVVGYGYDDSLLEENRHPTREDLDRVSTAHPIYLQHVSGHLAAVNSAALAAIGMSGETDDPPGGVIRRLPDSREPNGVLEETAAGPFRAELMRHFDENRFRELLRQAVGIHAGFGITTIQDGASSLADVAMMRDEATRDPFAVDVVAFPTVNSLDDESVASIEKDDRYSGGFRVGGVKFWLDGSPQGRTAYLSKPYTEGPPGQDSDYRAYPTYPSDAYKKHMARLIGRGMPVLSHANGDAAIDVMIAGVAAAVDGSTIPDHRSVIIHAQLIREDQLDRVKALGIVPSYYSAHPFFWGDWHRLSFGEERAARISPIRSTIDRGIPFTIHNDTPIVPPDIMRLIWITVNRKTRSGHVLGPEQRESVLEALLAVTIGSA
jgi:predicted amidohydrolase YtcJ